MTLADLRRLGRGVIAPSEVGPVLACSTRTVYRLMDAGQIPEIRLGRRRLIPLSPFLSMLGCEPATGGAEGLADEAGGDHDGD